MPVPKQLSQITILRTRYPDARKVLLQQQSQQQAGVLTVGLLLADSLALDLGRIADPQLHTEFCQQPLKPAGVTGGLHPHAHAYSSCRQFPIKLLGFSITVGQPPFATLSCLCIDKRDVLIARVIIHAYNDHVRLLSPESAVLDKPQSTRVQGADVVMQSNKALLQMSGNALTKHRINFKMCILPLHVNNLS